MKSAMNQRMIVIFSIFLVFFSVTNAENETCDRILDSMIDSCKSIRATLVSTSSLDPKVACCKNARYNLCVEGVKGYVTVAKSVRLCQEANYEAKLQSLESNIAMKAIKTLCQNFDTKTCITDTINNAWGSVSETLNPKNLSSTFSKGFNEAMSSINNFFKNIGSQGQENVNGLSNRLSGILPQQAFNHYSLVPDQQGGESENSFAFAKLLKPFTSSSVEVVPKNSDTKKTDDSSRTGFNQLLDSLFG